MSRESSIQTLKEMGFSEIQAIGALNASKDDLNKAIAFLFGEDDDTAGSGSEQSPIHVEQISVPSYDSVAVSNPKDIPDFQNLSHTSHTVEKVEQDPFSDSNGSASDSDNTSVIQEYESNIGASSDENLEDSESDADQPFPPNEKSDSHKFPMILNKVKALRSWVPVITVLANFKPFVRALEHSNSSEPIVKELQTIVKHFTSFNENTSWYVTTQNLAEQLPDEFPSAGYGEDEMLLNMMNCLVKLEPTLKPLFESSVESIEDDIHKELVVLEIESDSRSTTLYETLNELFWQKDFELFGQIKYDYVAPLVIYQLEHDENTPCAPFQLPETFYPEIYSNKALKQVKKELDGMALAEKKYHEVNRKLMELNFFQGMKVDNLISKAAKTVASQSPDSTSDLETLLATISQKRTDAIEQQNEYKLSASPQRLKSFDKLISENPDLQPYSLLGVIFSETHYFVRFGDTWADMATGTDIDFATVKRRVEEASSAGPHLITAIYERQGDGPCGGDSSKSTVSRPIGETGAHTDYAA